MENDSPAPGSSPLDESSAAQDSATPGKKPIDDERPDKHDQREHPQRETSKDD